MSALLKNENNLSSHYWMLWIAPNKSEIERIKALPLEQKQKVLMLHPKSNAQLCDALKMAITSGLYQSITMNKALIPANQHQFIEILALKYQTHINWLNQYTTLNSAAQLNLI